MLLLVGALCWLLLVGAFLNGPLLLSHRFVIPHPSQTTIDVVVGQKHYFFHQDDFHTSFAGFLSTLPPELQLAKSAVEMNR